MEDGEIRTLDYDPEREREQLMEKAEQGRKYQIASEVLDEIMDTQRENIIRQLETTDFENDSVAVGLVLYLRVLRICKNLITQRIDEGKLAGEELSEYGDN